MGAGVVGFALSTDATRRCGVRATGVDCSREGGRDLTLCCDCAVGAVAVLLARVCADGVRLLSEEDVDPAEVGRVWAWGLVVAVDGGYRLCSFFAGGSCAVGFCFNDVDLRRGAAVVGGLLGLRLTGLGLGAAVDEAAVAADALGLTGSRLGETLRAGSCWRSFGGRLGAVEFGFRNDRARVSEDIVATATRGRCGRSVSVGWSDVQGVFSMASSPRDALHFDLSVLNAGEKTCANILI